MPIICILVVREKKFAQRVPLPQSQERKTFSPIFIAFSGSSQNSVHFEIRNQLYSLNISEVSASEKCGYWNARKLLFQNTLQKSTCSRVLNTAETNMEALLLELSIDATHIELDKISVKEISNLKTVR